MHGLSEYLRRKGSKKQLKATRRQQIYEELRLEYPSAEISLHSVDSPNPHLLIQTQDASRSGVQRTAHAGPSIPVPRYWAHRTPRAFYSEGYYVPRFVIENGLLDIRTDFYARSSNKETNRPLKSRTGGMAVNMQMLYDNCEDYRTVLVADFPYDGTDEFFMKKCKKGTVSEQLRAALGDGLTFLSGRPAPSQETSLHALKSPANVATSSIPDIFGALPRPSTIRPGPAKNNSSKIEHTSTENALNLQGMDDGPPHGCQIPGLCLDASGTFASLIPSIEPTTGADSPPSQTDTQAVVQAPLPKGKSHGNKLQDRMKRLKF